MCLTSRFRPLGAGIGNYLRGGGFANAVENIFYMNPPPAFARNHFAFSGPPATRQICCLTIDNTTKMSYCFSMIRAELLSILSPAECCMCGRALSVRDLREFYGMTDETLRDGIHCPACAAHCLTLCRECSCRYTADRSGMCGECQRDEHAYILSS
jgi:hypothetical protein